MASNIEQSSLWKVPPELRIRLLHEDAHVLVIEKPANLRSVPGTLTRSKGTERERKTAQEAWVEALSSFKCVPRNDHVHRWARKLADSPRLESIPRKLQPFIRFCQRNHVRLSPKGETHGPRPDFEVLGTQLFSMIFERQRSFLNLPQATNYEDSAFGQLILMGYANDKERPLKLFVVHRLDCETSGVMVFARSQQVASFLGKAWRERDQVVKSYVARVQRWPPYQTQHQTEGTIELALRPSEERPKWKVDESGKPSKTFWKLRQVKDGRITLDLTPLTGRTHQLRIHLAEVGGGIEGDSLYGDNPVIWNPDNPKGCRLFLHAEQLSFPNPENGQHVTFSAPVSW